MLKFITGTIMASAIAVSPNIQQVNINHIIGRAAKTHVEKIINLEIDYNYELKKLGFYKEEYKDLKLDNRNALIRFQSEHNLTVDGLIGKEVRGAILKRMIYREYRPNDIVLEPPSDNYWITVNKSKRILTLYKGKDVVKKYPVAQGKDPGFTPEGKFTVVTKAVNPYWSHNGKSAKGGAPDNPLGKRWIGISYGGGWKYGVHGNNAPYSIGTNVSLGCIRMINADVEELYEIISLNTPIWIGTDMQLKSWGVNQESYLRVTI